MTKALIGESLKVLMRNHPFEKITIKMITDEAGVIRPTFYNYFCDKYEVVDSPPDYGKDYNDFLCLKLGIYQHKTKERTNER